MYASEYLVLLLSRVWGLLEGPCPWCAANSTSNPNPTRACGPGSGASFVAQVARNGAPRLTLWPLRSTSTAKQSKVWCSQGTAQVWVCTTAFHWTNSSKRWQNHFAKLSSGNAEVQVSLSMISVWTLTMSVIITLPHDSGMKGCRSTISRTSSNKYVLKYISNNRQTDTFSVRVEVCQWVARPQPN